VSENSGVTHDRRDRVSKTDQTVSALSEILGQWRPHRRDLPRMRRALARVRSRHSREA